MANEKPERHATLSKESSTRYYTKNGEVYITVNDEGVIKITGGSQVFWNELPYIRTPIIRHSG